MDCNPDGQDLARIAQITGLSKRVTQVTIIHDCCKFKPITVTAVFKLTNLCPIELASGSFQLVKFKSSGSLFESMLAFSIILYLVKRTSMNNYLYCKYCSIIAKSTVLNMLNNNARVKKWLRTGLVNLSVFTVFEFVLKTLNQVYITSLSYFLFYFSGFFLTGLVSKLPCSPKEEPTTNTQTDQSAEQHVFHGEWPSHQPPVMWSSYYGNLHFIF